MSADPYHTVQAEIQSALANAGTLLASFRRIRGMSRGESEELAYARSELKATLSALEADLDDLEESVSVVERSGARSFGLSDAEVATRRRYVDSVRRALEGMRVEVNGDRVASGSGRSPASAAFEHPLASAPSSRGARSPAPFFGSGLGRGRAAGPRSADVDLEAGGEDDTAAWARAEQEMMIREQDRALDSITGTLTTLADQGRLIGHEVGEHVEMLQGLDQDVDRADTKLGSAMKRMKKFVRDTEETKSGWCVGILTVVLMVLLLVAILI